MIRVVNASMTAAVRAVSVERGLDPRDFALVVGGGAGGLHATALARDLGIEQVVIPREAGTLCAFGMTVTDVRHDYVGALHASSEDLDPAALDGLYAGLEGTGRSRLLEDGFAAEEIAVERSVDARYPGQVYELTVAIPAVDSYGPESLAEIVSSFHDEHERQFGYRREGMAVEFLHWRSAAIGRIALGAPAETAAAAETAPVPVGARTVYVPSEGMVEVPMYKVESLEPRRPPGRPRRRRRRHDDDPARRRRRAQLRRGGQLPDRGDSRGGSRRDPSRHRRGGGRDERARRSTRSPSA